MDTKKTYVAPQLDSKGHVIKCTLGIGADGLEFVNTPRKPEQ